MHNPVQERHPSASGAAAGRWKTLAFCVLAVLATAVLGGIGSRDASSFYPQLSLPSWAPPGSVFGPVWTTLYLLMAVAAWLVATAPGRHGRALGLFGAQLVANALWSWIFFAWRSGGLAVLEVVVLLALVVATTVAFWRVRRLAGVLLLPYVAWVSFATALTLSAWQRNPSLL